MQQQQLSGWHNYLQMEQDRMLNYDRSQFQFLYKHFQYQK